MGHHIAAIISKLPIDEVKTKELDLTKTIGSVMRLF